MFLLYLDLSACLCGSCMVFLLPIIITSCVGIQKKLIVNLVKIQNDNTVEVDITKSAPVASELLELHTAERTPINIDGITSESNKSIPKLNITLLVLVGTRGDVQPFLAIAKRLQVFAIIC